MKKILIITVISLLLPCFALAEENGFKMVRPSVRILGSNDFSVEKEFYPFPEESTVQGLNITSANLDLENKKEIIISAGRNELPLVKIFNYKGEFLSEFLAYGRNFSKGLKSTVADLYGDGSPEIITAPNKGGGPHIRVFDDAGFLYFDFFAFDEGFRGGANVTTGDVNKDGQTEIIAGAGNGMEPLVKIFDNYGGFIKEFLAYEKDVTSGVNVLAVDLNKDGQDEIITAPNVGYKPLVRVFNYEGEKLLEFFAYHPGFWGGVNLAAGDIDQDGFIEILTGAGFSGGAHLRIFDTKGNPKINPKLFAFEDFKGGISIADGNIDNNGKTELLAATQTVSPTNRYESYKTIDVDLRKQKLYTYYKGAPEDEYWISSGRGKFATPKGNYKVYNKVPITTMSWFYGPDNPENYSLDNVPWVLPFYGAYTIHGTYWHSNFGNPMSHGCINMFTPEAKRVYDWANIGTPVNVFSSEPALASTDE